MADEAEAGGGRGVIDPRRWLDGRLPRILSLRRGHVRMFAAGILVTLVALGAWWVHDYLRRGEVELVNMGSPLTVEVLDESGTALVAAPIEVITRTTLRLPDGDYRVRLSGMGRLGQTYRMDVNRGESTEYRVSLDRGRLLFDDSDGPPQKRPPAEPARLHASTAVLELSPGKGDLVNAENGTILRRDGKTGAVVWDVARPSGPYRPLRDPGPWVRAIAEHPDEVTTIDPPPDLNGDGIRDIVWSYHNAPAVLAMSGKDGTILWNYHADPDGQGGPRPAGPATWRADPSSAGPSDKEPPRGQILGEPAVFDVDGDGTPDLIATLAFGTPEVPSDNGGSDARWLDVRSRLVVAVSGKTGRRLWSAPAGDADGGGHLDWRAVLVRGRRSATVAFVHGSRWVGLDAATGAPRGEPLDLGEPPVRPVQYGDLDGDGEPELLALAEVASGSGLSLSAYSLTARKPLWAVPATALLALADLDPAADWPWLVRLDPDGTTALLVEDSGPMSPGPGYCGVRRLDGRTGRTLWSRPMRPNPGQYDGRTHCLEAPDLDGDGVRDVVFAWCVPISSDTRPSAGDLATGLYVDALSGKDGHPLWSYHRSASRGGYDEVGAPVWWGRGPDGWPLVAVPGRRVDPELYDAELNRPVSSPVVHVLEASTGREQHVAIGLSDPRTADLDGDGVLDLWGQVESKVAAFHGTPPTAWRAFGSYSGAVVEWAPRLGGDLDGDGVGDVLTGVVASGGGLSLDPFGDPTAVARSGADGHVLWKSRLGSAWSWVRSDGNALDVVAVLPPPHGDLDGDGTVDVLVAGLDKPTIGSPGGAPGLPLRVLSGRTGRLVWSAGPMPAGLLKNARWSVYTSSPSVVVVVKPGGRPDLVVRSMSQGNPVAPGSASQAAPDERLTRFSGRSGRVVWDIRLPTGEATVGVGLLTAHSASLVADLDGDRSADMLRFGRFIDQKGETGVGLWAISLATGRTIWTYPLATPFADSDRFQTFTGDLDGDGRAEALLTTLRVQKSGLDSELVVLDGRDGHVRWSWRPGPQDQRKGLWSARAAIATVSADGRKAVALLLRGRTPPDVLVLLDGRGHELARCELGGRNHVELSAMDLSGDGLDELIAGSAGDLQVLGPDMKPLWSQAHRPIDRQTNPEDVRWTLPASARRPGLVVVPGRMVRNGPDGRPIGRGPGPIDEATGLRCLDSGDPALPLLWVVDEGYESACYRTMPLSEDGKLAPPRGTLTPPGLAPADDPRWRRLLPWVVPIADWIGPRGFIVMIALALVNLAIPLGLLALAARRRPWTIRLLLALPAAAAVPLYALHAFEPLMPAEFASIPVSPRELYVLATLAGAPLVAFAGAVGWSLLRLRWRRLLALAALLVVCSALVSAGWIAYDIRTMPPPGHYDRSGWAPALVLLPGAGVAGSLLILGWILRRPIRWLMKPRRAASAS